MEPDELEMQIARAVLAEEHVQEQQHTIDALVTALEKISNVSFPGWEAQTAVDYCRSTADAALALARGEG